MKTLNRIKEIKYWIKAVWASIRGQEIDFAVKQIEGWFNGEIVSQKITNAVYDSDVSMELEKDWNKTNLKQQENSKQFEKHEKRYKALLEDLEKDDAGYASTQLHFFRTRCDELDTLTHHLFLTDVISFDQESDIKYLSSRAHEIIKNRLQERLLWLARGIDESISIRKQKGVYADEFDTATILANAFNDILGDTYGKNFTGHPGKE